MRALDKRRRKIALAPLIAGDPARELDEAEQNDPSEDERENKERKALESRDSRTIELYPHEAMLRAEDRHERGDSTCQERRGHHIDAERHNPLVRHIDVLEPAVQLLDQSILPLHASIQLVRPYRGQLKEFDRLDQGSGSRAYCSQVLTAL